MQGVGKSTIMSLLAGAALTGDSGTTTADGGGALQLREPCFAPQTLDAVLHAVHQTTGVDMFVTPERFILLDTQALLSPSVLLELQRRETSLPAEVQTHENLLELQSLRLAMLLFSVCHLVVCVHDVQLDPLTLRTLRLAQMLRHRLPDISHLALSSSAAAAAMTAAVTTPASGSAEDHGTPVVEYNPRLAFVFNRMPPSTFAHQQHEMLRAVLQKLFPDAQSADLPTTPGGSDGAGVLCSSCSSCSSSRAERPPAPMPGDEAAAVEATATELCVLLLPENDASAMAVCSMHRGYKAEAERARYTLLSLRRARFARGLTEREWLRGVGRMWELIRRSALVSDYNRSLQKLHLFQ